MEANKEIVSKLNAARTVVGDGKHDSCRLVPDVAIVLGSGLGALADEVQDSVRVPYIDIPGMPVSGVSGHGGQLVVGRLNGVNVVIMKGRVHLYEGFSAQQVVFGVRLMKWLGAITLVVTNAAGGIRKDLEPGTLMLINDHINLTGESPLVGPNVDKLGPRFPDMSKVYSLPLREAAQQATKVLWGNYFSPNGVYAGCKGPEHETPAEVLHLKKVGADCVGMSTVLEAIAARHMGLSVLGISCITNWAAGVKPNTVLTHDEVEKIAGQASGRFCSLIKAVLPEIVKVEGRSPVRFY